ncbi:MAG: hypothetical protein FWD19_00235 [Defluviitaleaceae bacterium]|nr:hypothetical protein [Defluviitaleaceae bacterium]
MKAEFLSAKKNLLLARKGFALLETKHIALSREIIRREKNAREIRERLKIFLREAERVKNILWCECAVDFEKIFSKTEQRSEREVRVPNFEELFSKTEQRHENFSSDSKKNFASDIEEIFFQIEQRNDDVFSYAIKNFSAAFDEAFFAWRRVLCEQKNLAQVEEILARLKIRAERAKKRAAALKNIAIPTYEQRVKFFSARFEENERDEIVRLKAIKNAAAT